MLRPVMSIFLVLFVLGCTSTFRETHYFKSEVPGGKIPNYYRLTVNGCTLFSSSRYVSGYFDPETLDSYFNEYTQPAGAALFQARMPDTVSASPTPPRKKTESNPAVAAKANGNPVEPLSKGLRGKKLIMILSSNSDAVATQIGALAANRQFTASLTGLLAYDRYAAADDAERRLMLEKSRETAISNLACQLVGSIKESDTKEVVEQKLVSLINALAAGLGYDGTFTDLEKAAQWLETTRTRLLRSER